MAAKLRKDGFHVDLEAGSYGSFKVLVDGKAILDGGAFGFLGILPTAQAIGEKIGEVSELRKSQPDSAVKDDA
ncbi:MAG: hypothetical protein ABL888_17070 [Pirellulaceae bacterium]